MGDCRDIAPLALEGASTLTENGGSGTECGVTSLEQQSVRPSHVK
jgi:hypothetical protein